MPKSFPHSRREFIKLLSGVTAAPFLALPNRPVFAQSKPPLRFLTLIDTYGIPAANRNDIWVNSTAGDYPLNVRDLGTILQPLSAYVDNMLVVSGVNLESQSRTRDSRTHHFMTTHTLTGSSALNSTRNVQALQGIEHASIDVHIGQYLHQDYGLASPRIYDHLFFTDYAQRDSATFCYNEGGSQKRSIAGALNARDALFGDVEVSPDLALNQVTNQALLDAISLVQERVGALAGELSNANRDEVLGAYQESVDSVHRELGLKNENIITLPAELATGVANSGGSNNNNPDDVPSMFKNIYHAFAFDLVSSVTYAFGGEKINQQKHAFLYDDSQNDNELSGLLGKNLHASSHRTDDVAGKVHELVRAYQSRELATLLDRMSTTLDSDGSTLFDNTVVFFTSQMSNNTHRNEDYPIFIIAGKNTNLQGGFHYDCEGSSNNDLLTTLAQGLTMSDDNFGGHDRSGNYLDELNNGPISKMLKG